MDVIYILWLRQMKRYFRSKSRVVGAIGQPILFLLALGYGIGSVYKKAGQGNYIEFWWLELLYRLCYFLACFGEFKFCLINVLDF